MMGVSEARNPAGERKSQTEAGNRWNKRRREKQRKLPAVMMSRTKASPGLEINFQLMEGSGFPPAWHSRVTLDPSFTTRSLERLMIFGGTKLERKKGKGLNKHT